MQIIKRSALYALVWAKPMTHACQELGISDVGLAKLCRRYDIPTPRRGHWAKLVAGKHSPITPLSQPEKDFHISLATADSNNSDEKRAKEMASDAVVTARTEWFGSTAELLRNQRKGPHPLIRATRAFVAKIPALEHSYARSKRSSPRDITVPIPPYVDKGRRLLDVPDGLNLTVSDEAMIWAIDWHERLISVLEKFGVQFSMGNRADEANRQVVVEHKKERLFLRMHEGYKRHKLDASDQSGTRSTLIGGRDWIWVSSGRLTLQARGTEYKAGAQWSGHQAVLDEQLNLIGGSLLSLLESQPALRERRLEREARAREESMRSEFDRKRTESLKEQVAVAFEASSLHEQEQRLQRFLDHLERELPGFQRPYQQRLAVWIQLIRQEIKQSPPHLQVVAAALKGMPWSKEPPAWWPQDTEWPTGLAE